MSQSDLLPAADKAVIDRPLIAFAFLAQATQVEGDMMSGLTPIFKPIAKQRVGKKFDANEFAAAVASLYGIKIHPWAVDDLASRLERSGLLVAVQVTKDVHEYVYANVDATFDDVTEDDIRRVVAKFIEFAQPLLIRLNAKIDEKALEDGFFDELTAVDFHSILLQPERKDLSASTLGMPRKPEEHQHNKDLTARSHLDVLCAAFIVEIFHSDRALYDLVARIATGALLTQVVLNIQDPGKTASLLTLRVLLDAPLVMSLLDLTSEESFKYASELRKALKEHDATIEVFRHSLDEIRDNLRAVISGVSQGVGFGATARRLQSPTFRAYVGGVLKDLEAAVARSGIRIVEAPVVDTYYRFFTESDEDYFYGMLGSFWNPTAQKRDAASIAGIMRLRQGHKARMSAFHQAKYVFVTQNPRVSECSARMLISLKLGSSNDVPAAITDRFLAGLIWILYGGKAAELTRYRLLASCTAALEVRNDVMTKMHGFLTKIDETKAKQFRAMMTDERAGQHLMQLTLGDSLLIPSTADAEAILQKLESRFEAKHKAVSDKAIEEVTTTAAELVRQAEIAREREAQLARDATINEIQVRSELESALQATERERQEWAERELSRANSDEQARKALEDRLKAEQHARIAEKMPLMEKCVRSALSVERNRTLLLAVFVGLVLFLAALLGTEWFTKLDSRLSLIGAIIAGFIGSISFWNRPQLLFGRWVRRARDRELEKQLQEYALTRYREVFDINWETGSVGLPAATDARMATLSVVSQNRGSPLEKPEISDGARNT